MSNYKLHSQFSSTRSADLIFERRLKRLRKLLAMTDDSELLYATWVLDWRREKKFEIPAGFDYPAEYVRAAIGETGRVHSWELETLLIEALGNPKRAGRRRVNTRAWNFIGDVVSALRSAENAEGGRYAKRDIFHELNRILYRQLPWQSHAMNAADTIRWYSIFSNEELTEIYRSIVGTSPLPMLRIGLALSMIFQSYSMVTNLPPMPTMGIEESDLKAFFTVMARDLDGFRSECRRIVKDYGLTYRESPFRKTPLVSSSRRNGLYYLCPLKDVLFWRVTSGLYYDVIQHVRAKHIIGDEFERFEKRLLSAAFPDLSVHGETPYGPKRFNKKTPDILVAQDKSLRIAFECKAKRLPLSDKVGTADYGTSIAIAELAKAVFQLVRFRTDLRSGEYRDLDETSDTQHVVLTLDDWMFTGPATKAAVFAKAREMLERQRIIPHFALTDIVFCPASELDIMITKLNFEQLIKVFATNQLPERQHYAPLPLSNELFPSKPARRKYPLIRELDEVSKENFDRQV